MALPFVLDVAIGLVFIYLILSLLASEIQELLTTLFQWRAKHLRDAIEVFLAGGNDTPDEEQVKDLVSRLYEDPLLKNINQESKSLVAKGARKITRWLIPGNRKGAFGFNQSSGPSYIASETFSTSLLERIGLSTLARKLIEVRLEKFATRIVGSFKVNDWSSASDWEKGRIRVIAAKAKKDWQSDSNFSALVEEYQDILNDFYTEETNLATAVERMGESLDAYIANYPLPASRTTMSAPSPAAPEPSPTGSTSTVPVSIDPIAAPLPDAPAAESPPDSAAPTDAAPTGSFPDAPTPPTGEDLDYFAKRLRSFKLSLFGANNERAILAGGLRPSLTEIAELADESSTTYQEVLQAYQSLIAQAEPLETKVNPALEQQLLETYPEAIEKEIVKAYPEAVEEQFLAVAPDVFRSVEQQLIERRRKIYRAKSNSQVDLLKQQRRTIHTALGQLGGEQRQQILSAVLNQFGGEQRTLVINKSLEALSNEQRYAVIDIVFSELNLTTSDRSVYDNYQTYKSIRQVLSKLPTSVKESFAILARRAQSKVQQTNHDLNQFSVEVATWFDNSMERASGVYKRNAKGVAILIGLLLASSTNSDAFYIVTRLSNDENLRQVITNRAAGIVANSNAPQAGGTATPSGSPPNEQTPGTSGSSALPSSSASLEVVKQQTDSALKDLSLPIGWKPENLVRQFDCQPDPTRATDASCKTFLNKPGAIDPATIPQLIAAKPLDSLKMLIGWIVSGIGISMGAPFWFDLLGKIMNVRNSGGKPPSPATNETAK